MTPESETETYDEARARLSAQAVRNLLEAAMLIEQIKCGSAAAQRLHDSMEEGVTTLEFTVHMEATCATLVGRERGPAGERCVLDVLLFARPGAGLSLN